MANTGKTLKAIEINDHLIASEILEVDSKESNMITTKLTRKGFTMLEISLASLSVILMGTLQVAPIPVLIKASYYTNLWSAFCQVHRASYASSNSC